MSALRPPALMLPLLLLACNDNKLSVYNTPPSVSITSPEDSSAFQPDTLIELFGVVRDAQQDTSTLELSVSSSLDGDLGVPAADDDGYVYMALTQLSAGQHALTLTAIDNDGVSGLATVTIDVGFGGDAVGAPTVTLIGPAEGDEFTPAEIITVVGSATDDEQSWDTLSASIVSSRDGLVWEGNPASSGAITVDLPALSVGTHSLSLAVQDDDGNVGQAEVSFEVLEDGRPQVEITSPTTGSSVWTIDTVLLEGQVSDDVSDPDVLDVSWSSSLQGELAVGLPDSSGYVAAPVSLIAGTHVLSLEAVDEDLNSGSDSVTLTVIDPLDYDNDGDGQTENEGDCDDSESTVFSGAAESCDDLDNDCDGDVNEDWWDAYEVNDSLSNAYDLGRVNGGIWSSRSFSVSGLMLDTRDDEDWFRLDAYDRTADNVRLDVRVTGLAASLFWVVEIWDLNDGQQVIDSASGMGMGSLSATHLGGWDNDDDHFAVRVYATTWASQGCTAPYSLSISRTSEIP